MSRKDKDLLNLLKRSIGEPIAFVHGKVLKVDKALCTCTLDVGGQVFDDVQLKSIIKNNMGLVLYPKLHSTVYANFMPGSQRLIVVAADEIDSFHIKIETTEVSGNKDGLVLKRGNESLKSILAATYDAILAMTVTTGVGPSGTPINFTQFQQLKDRLNNLLTA